MKLRNLVFLFLLSGCATARVGYQPPIAGAPEINVVAKKEHSYWTLPNLLTMIVPTNHLYEYYYYQNQPASNQIRY